VDARARQPPPGGEPTDAAAHDHDRRSALSVAHVAPNARNPHALPPTMSGPAPRCPFISSWCTQAVDTVAYDVRAGSALSVHQLLVRPNLPLPEHRPFAGALDSGLPRPRGRRCAATTRSGLPA